MIITTAERIIKTAQADRTDDAIMLYAVNCLYMCNAYPKNRSKFNEIKKSKKRKCAAVKVYRVKVD